MFVSHEHICRLLHLRSASSRWLLWLVLATRIFTTRVWSIVVFSAVFSTYSCLVRSGCRTSDRKNYVAHALHAEHRTRPWCCLCVFSLCHASRVCVHLPVLAPLFVASFPFIFYNFFYLFSFRGRTFLLAWSTPFIVQSFRPAVAQLFRLRWDIGTHPVDTPSFC